MTEPNFFVHPSAQVSPHATIGVATKIWKDCQVCPNAVIGEQCVLGNGVYIDAGVQIGNRVKIQNGVSVYHGVTLEDGVFCGPHCVFTNDLRPRAINPDGTLKRAEDWQVSETRVGMGASIGAHATIVCGVTIGRWAMIGAGAIVTRSVPDYALVYGAPARVHGFVCPCGHTLLADSDHHNNDQQPMLCPSCDARIEIPRSDFLLLEQGNA